MGSSALSLTLLLMSFIHSGLTQDLPRSTLTVTPDNTVFTGERVILTCEIESNRDWRQRNGLRYDWTPDWRYEWWKGNSNIQVSERYTVEENTLTIKRSESSDTGLYWCRGHIDGYLSSESNSVSLSVKDLPKPQLTVDPESRVFTGETVNLKCVITQSYSGWTYEWYKGRDRVKLQSSDRYTVNTHTLTIRGATESDRGQFWCKVQRYGSPSSSQESERIDLAVNDLPKTELTVDPDTAVFTGERVSLTCEIESDHRDWRYEWNKGWRGTTSYTSISQSSQRLTVDRNTLTIEGSESSDTGDYWCEGHIEGRSVSSHTSSAVYLSVKDFPRSTLTVTPDNTVFTGERVILTCVIESHRDWRQRNGLTHDQRYYQTPVWSYEWYKDRVKLQSSDRYTVNTDTLTIRAVTTSDEGLYTCRGQRDKRPNSSQSSSVSLSVTDLPKTELTVDPKSPDFTGETVNLTCVIESNHTEWTYEWYKGGNNSVKLQSSDRYTVNTDTLTIRGLNESDQGQYTCRGQRDGRPNSSQESERIDLAVNAQISFFIIPGFLLAACPYLLVTVVLLYKCSRARVKSPEAQRQSL